jgi:hypothetical protein
MLLALQARLDREKEGAASTQEIVSPLSFCTSFFCAARFRSTHGSEPAGRRKQAQGPLPASRGVLHTVPKIDADWCSLRERY